MVIDTSAIFAAITGEPDSGIYRNAIISAPLRLISAVTLLETQIVLVSRSGSDSLPILDELMERAGIVVVAFDEPMAEAAFDAFRLFGKGRVTRRSSTSSIVRPTHSPRRATCPCYSRAMISLRRIYDRPSLDGQTGTPGATWYVVEPRTATMERARSRGMSIG
jgi:uncharacterized protein with PIN domain